MCFWARRDKKNHKTVGWDKCPRCEISLLLLRQRQETRCRDEIWSKFLSLSSRMQEIPNTQPAEFNLFKGPFWQRKVCRCVLWMERVRPQPRVKSEYKQQRINVFNTIVFYVDARSVSAGHDILGFPGVFSEVQPPTQARYRHMLLLPAPFGSRKCPRLAWLPLRSLVVSRTWWVSCGRVPGLLLRAPLSCGSCSSTDVSRYNIYLWSWGSSFEHPSFFRLDFFSCVLPVPFGSSRDIQQKCRTCYRVEK